MRNAEGILGGIGNLAMTAGGLHFHLLPYRLPAEIPCQCCPWLTTKSLLYLMHHVRTRDEEGKRWRSCRKVKLIHVIWHPLTNATL